MEVRSIGVWHSNKCPFSGMGLAVVVEKTEHRAHLLYPFTLEEWTMPIETKFDDDGNVVHEGYTAAAGELYANNAKIAAIIRERLRIHLALEKTVPNPKTVARVLAALEGKQLSEVEREVVKNIVATTAGENNKNVEKLSRKLKMKSHPELKGREAKIAASMVKLGPATVGEIVDAVKTQFKKPDGVERAVTYFTNRWLKLGWVEAI